MQGVLKQTSPYGFKLVGGDDKWVNMSKYDKSGTVSLNGLAAGDTVEYEVNAKNYLTSLKKVQAQSKSTASSGTAGQTAQDTKSSSPAQSDSSVGSHIIREAVLKVAFAQPLVLLGNLSEAEALTLRLERYVLTGKFNSVDETDLDKVPF